MEGVFCIEIKVIFRFYVGFWYFKIVIIFNFDFGMLIEVSYVLDFVKYVFVVLEEVFSLSIWCMCIWLSY